MGSDPIKIMISLQTKLSDLSGIGPTRLKAFQKLGLQTVEDLIYHFPRYFENWGRPITISQLKSKGKGVIKVKVILVHQRKTFKKKMFLTEAIVSDNKDSLKVIWFNQPFLKKILENKEIYLAGKITSDPSYGLSLINPVWEKINPYPIHTTGLVPVYPLTSKLTQKQIRSFIWLIFKKNSYFKDWLPDEIKKEQNLIDFDWAIRQIHFPSSLDNFKKAKKRLEFDELFLLTLANRIVRQTLKNKNAPSITFNSELTNKFLKTLPFKLTPSQKKESWRIIKDIEKPHPMNRLLCGDVGSGKTIVAILSILNCLNNNYQAVYMAPTEILAFQFFERTKKMFKDFPFKIALMTKSNLYLNEKQFKTKKALIKNIKEDGVNLIIGTHSLIAGEDTLKIKNLGLVIIDEQHRFGVEQRAKLAKNEKKGLSPHFLSLSATPIPRSLALTLYGDLDISYLSDMPEGRKKVITKIFNEEEKKFAYKAIRERLEKKELAFIICPLIDPSGKVNSKSVKEEYAKIKKEFSNFKVEMLHGKVKSQEKIKIIQDFSQGKINILVTTNIIEAGIDIPKATIMLILSAERFGLSQLYQLRGRIGRSEKQAYCFLIYENVGEAKKRLEAFLRAKNGLELAKEDLILRGPGALFGYEQTGHLAKFSLIDFKNISSIENVKKVALKFSSKYDIKKFPELWKKIKNYISS